MNYTEGISYFFESKRHPQAIFVFAPVAGPGKREVVEAGYAAMGYKIIMQS